MAKSSIHIKAGSAGNTLHNARENFSQSVVFTDEKNELLNSSKEALEIYRKELAERAKAYTNRTKQKLQSKAITHQSAVVNLLQHHTLEDLKDIKEYIEKTFDTKVFQIAIHRDEGKLVSKDGTELYSGEDFFRNSENNKLYYDKDFLKEIDLSKYTIEKNYHAHIEFMGLDSTGAGIKRNYFSMRKLSELQDFVAQSLKMERGINRYVKNQKSKKRFDPGTDKAISSREQKNQKELKLTVTELKSEIETYRKELSAKNKELKIYKQSDYADISSLKKALKKSNVEDIYQEFLKLKKENAKREKELTEAREALEKQEQLNNTLKQEKNDLATKDSNARKQIKHFNKIFIEVAKELNVEISNYTKVRDDIISKYKSTKQEVRELKKTIETLKEENSDLEQEIKLVEQRESELQSFRFDYYSSSNKSYELQKQLINAQETIETQKTTIDTLKEEKSVLKAKYEEIKEAFEDVAQKLSIKFNTVKQVAANIISKFKSTNQTETDTETDDEAWKRMVENAKQAEKQSLKLK